MGAKALLLGAMIAATSCSKIPGHYYENDGTNGYRWAVFIDGKPYGAYGNSQVTVVRWGSYYYRFDHLPFNYVVAITIAIPLSLMVGLLFLNYHRRFKPPKS
jgi:hypothetical protein